MAQRSQFLLESPWGIADDEATSGELQAIDRLAQESQQSVGESLRRYRARSAWIPDLSLMDTKP